MAGPVRVAEPGRCGDHGHAGVAGRTTLSGLTQLYTRHETHYAVHAGRWEAAHRADPQLDEKSNHRGGEEAVPVTGQANLRGLAPLVVVEVLYGLQQRVRGECTSYCRFLRRLVRELRRTQVSSLRSLPAQEEKVRQSLLNSLVTHLGRAFADPRTEIAKDRWDLTVLGHHGWLAAARDPGRAVRPRDRAVLAARPARPVARHPAARQPHFPGRRGAADRGPHRRGRAVGAP
jgi:hypothetical protein